MNGTNNSEHTEQNLSIENCSNSKSISIQPSQQDWALGKLARMGLHYYSYWNEWNTKKHIRTISRTTPIPMEAIKPLKWYFWFFSQYSWTNFSMYSSIAIVLVCITFLLEPIISEAFRLHTDFFTFFYQGLSSTQQMYLLTYWNRSSHDKSQTNYIANNNTCGVASRNCVPLFLFLSKTPRHTRRGIRLVEKPSKLLRPSFST